jgi:transmembrane sensor
MTQDPDHRREAALQWIVRTNDPDFGGWEEFTAWLEADPGNADAYHALADSEISLRPHVESVDFAPPERVKFRPRIAIAASVALLAGLGAALVGPRLMPIHYSTGPGEVRVVALGGQDRLVMNGDTRIELAGFDKRSLRLEQGQVLLQLRDEGKDKIHLTSGDLELVDVGTVFEVSRDGRSTRVLVSEGQVMADPDGARLKLASGQRLDTEDGATTLQAMPADAGSVGAFRRGQLVYLDEPLDKVAADLRRSTGIDFSTSAAMSGRRFSGTLSIAEVKRDPRSLQPLLGVSLRQSGKGWIMGGRV